MLEFTRKRKSPRYIKDNRESSSFIYEVSCLQIWYYSSDSSLSSFLLNPQKSLKILLTRYNVVTAWTLCRNNKILFDPSLKPRIWFARDINVLHAWPYIQTVTVIRHLFSAKVATDTKLCVYSHKKNRKNVFFCKCIFKNLDWAYREKILGLVWYTNE